MGTAGAEGWPAEPVREIAESLDAISAAIDANAVHSSNTNQLVLQVRNVVLIVHAGKMPPCAGGDKMERLEGGTNNVNR
jgi:hypothetical protein